MNDLSEIGARIKEVRGSLSQQAFADVLGVSRKTVIRYEAAETAPDALFLLALLEKFGAEPGWVIAGRRHEGSRSQVALSPDEAELVDDYRHSPPELKRALKASGSAFARRKAA